MKKTNKIGKRGTLILIILLLLIGNYYKKQIQPPETQNSFTTVEEAYTKRLSNIQVQGSGHIIKLLADDRQGSKHQKFIIEISPQLTLLIAHNIDLAPRLRGIKPGSIVSFCGEYEWNKRGGVVHWTHHDPAGRHHDGWLKFQGQIHQ